MQIVLWLSLMLFAFLFWGAVLKVVGWVTMGLVSFNKEYPKIFKLTVFICMVAIAWNPAMEYYQKWEREKRFEHNARVVYPAYSRTEKAMMTCVKSFNEQFFLAPAWKKHVPKGQSVTVDVYKYIAPSARGAKYIFVIPDALRKKVQFWLDSDVPHFKTYNQPVESYPDLSSVHFQKGQYLRAGYFAHYSSVSCDPVGSIVGNILSGKMYYIIIDGPFTPDISRKYDRAAYNEKVLNFKIKNLGMEGDVFKKSQLTPESSGMEKVYSIIL